MSRHDVGTVAVVRLDGSLAAGGAAQVKMALLHEFADHERVVVCDLAGLRAIAPSATSAFAAAAAAAGGWPIVRLGLARPRPAVATQLRKSGAGRFVVVENTVLRAAEAADDGPRALRDAVSLAPTTAVVEGRRFVADCCLRWRQPELGDAGRAVAGRLLQTVAALTQKSFQFRVTYEGGALTVRALLPAGVDAGGYALPDGVRLRIDGQGTASLTAGLAVDGQVDVLE